MASMVVLSSTLASMTAVAVMVRMFIVQGQLVNTRDSEVVLKTISNVIIVVRVRFVERNEKLISVAEELEFPKARDGDKEQLMKGMSEPEAYHHGLSYSLFPPFGLIVRVL